MSNESIGYARRAKGDLNQNRGVTFRVPYSKYGYDVTLKNDELDKIFKCGIDNVLANKPMPNYDYNIELENPDLPLFAGFLSVNAAISRDFRDISMHVSVVSQSQVNEHRGILIAQRHGLAGTWRLTEYQIAPPLRHLQ